MGAEWITAPEAARTYHVKRGTIYAWASADRWPRRGSRRSREYSWAAAQASYEKRHGSLAQHRCQQAS